MKKVLFVGLLGLMACGGEAFSVAVDGGTLDPKILSPEAGAADDGQATPTSVDPDAGAGAQDAGTIVLEDAHPVMTSDAGDVVDAGPSFCCYVAAGDFSQPVESGFTCGGVASRPRCTLGQMCQDSIFSTGIVVLCSDYPTDDGDLLPDAAPLRCSGRNACAGCLPGTQVACCKADDTCGCSSISPATACK